MSADSLTIGTTKLQAAPEEASTEQALVQFAPDTVGQGLAFYRRFGDKPAAVAALDAEAGRVMPILATSSSELIAYGMDALDDVIKTTRNVLQLTKDVKLPQDEDAALRNLKIQLDKAGDYDMSVAQNLARYREMKDRLSKRFSRHAAKAYFAAFQADRLTLEQLTDEMSGDLTTRAMHRAVAANATAKLHGDNQDSLLLLEERVAVLEKVREMAQQKRSALPAVLPSDDPHAEEANALDMFVRMLDLKVTEYAGRWFTGVALAPMLRVQYEQQIMMALKLHTSATIGMEKVRIILAQYAMSLDLQKDVDTVNSFDSFGNEMTQLMFKQTRATIGAVAQSAVSSSMTTETIGVMAQEVAGMIGDVQTAYATAKAEQAEKLVAMQDAVNVIEAAQGPGAKPIDLAKVGSVVASGRKTRSITAG